ncbi:MAG: hypothetical protein NZ551_07835 [Microscillaceae bacterium]|nr:hypothetical protein [Microscillaceae bacterium]MDW8461106.1 general stress protein [Cytophagales bacterium]
MKQHSVIVGTYDTHQQAIEALKVLQSHNFNMKHVSLVGKGEAVKEIDGVHTWEEVTTRGAELGAIAGAALGVLAGLSLITVPGLGVLYVGGALGALLGGFEGATLGALGGGILGSIFGSKHGAEGTVHGKLNIEDAVKYKKLVEEGRFLVIVHGDKDEIKHAHNILEEHSNSSGVSFFPVN